MKMLQNLSLGPYQLGGMIPAFIKHDRQKLLRLGGHLIELLDNNKIWQAMINFSLFYDKERFA
jgi:hypothetical protein